MAAPADDKNQEFFATHRFARISARKARYVIDLIRGLPVEKALQSLKFCLKRGGPMIAKVLKSAVANATQAAGLEASKLYVAQAVVGDGPRFKRFRPRAMGRAYPRQKRTCHIQVAVRELRDGGPAVKRRSQAPLAGLAAGPSPGSAPGPGATGGGGSKQAS
ncbi:MAG: 50S ribosomal protein L22 [Planctomycetes bacterium]|nr:50S ribosomal protein L22 [Planctomycetota bacterium]